MLNCFIKSCRHLNYLYRPFSTLTVGYIKRSSYILQSSSTISVPNYPCIKFFENFLAQLFRRIARRLSNLWQMRSRPNRACCITRTGKRGLVKCGLLTFELVKHGLETGKTRTCEIRTYKVRTHSVWTCKVRTCKV